MVSLRVNRDVIRIANKITGSAEAGILQWPMGMPILLVNFFSVDLLFFENYNDLQTILHNNIEDAIACPFGYICLHLQLNDNMVKAKRLETQKITTKITFSAARVRYDIRNFLRQLFVTFAFRKKFHNKELRTYLFCN